MKTADIRQRFLDFFTSQGHDLVPSASLVHADPTLLFVNAGMVPFKPYFDGSQEAPWDRAVTAQKCVRTLDIEEVGRTTRHGTFFQMLGNFSFGDYFKAGAIDLAWRFVTGSEDDGCLGFDPESIWVTVLHGDDEAASLWRDMGISAARIQERGLKDNYWHMGVPGPGGPCSEIYVDRGPEFGPDGGPEADEDRFLEIWNLVFQQQELSAVRRKDDFDVARDLDSKNIDTGAGLERIAYLKQGKSNLYEIDEVFPVISRAAELANTEYGANPENDVRLRVIGDHVRSAMMLMTDGVAPGNEARGYVLRRLLRRTVRSLRLLGVSDPALLELMAVSRGVMSASYPDIDQQWDRVRQLADNEEQAFRRTLTSGTQLFEAAAASTKKSGTTSLSGAEAFKLHDTHGFPIDLTLEMAAEQGLSVDVEAFTEEMTAQRQRAKADAKAKKSGGVSTDVWRPWQAEPTPFLGYTDLTADTAVLGLVRDGQSVASASPGDTVEVILRETPFYAESGGQDADAGTLTGSGLQADVIDVQKPVPGLVAHRVVVGDGELSVGMPVTAAVDGEARFGACQAHTATHVVHAVLRQVIGSTATQAGSYNKPGYLRFDFSASSGMTADMRQEVEGLCNEAVRDDLPVTDREMPLEEAKALGAMAMFGEKYGNVVRMVEMGGPFSRELCGGTHVRSSAQIGLLNLLGESSVGSGVRRVEALVSRDAFARFAGERALAANLSDMLKVPQDQLVERVGALVADLRAAEKKLADIAAREVLQQAASMVDTAVDINGIAFVGRTVAAAPGDLRSLATDVRQRLGERAGVVAVASDTGDKAALVVAVTPAAQAKGLKAGALVSLGCAELGGKGGGKPDLAQGGGSNPQATPLALDAIQRVVQELS